MLAMGGCGIDICVYNAKPPFNATKRNISALGYVCIDYVFFQHMGNKITIYRITIGNMQALFPKVQGKD